MPETVFDDGARFTGGDHVVRTGLALGVTQGVDALFQTTIGFVVALRQLTGKTEEEVCGTMALACSEACEEYEPEYVEQLARDLATMESEVRDQIERSGLDTRVVLPEWLKEEAE